MRLHFTDKEGDACIDQPSTQFTGQFDGNLFKKGIMEHFTSFSSITMRYQECHNLTAIVLRNKITFFTSTSLDAVYE